MAAEEAETTAGDQFFLLQRPPDETQAEMSDQRDENHAENKGKAALKRSAGVASAGQDSVKDEEQRPAKRQRSSEGAGPAAAAAAAATAAAPVPSSTGANGGAAASGGGASAGASVAAAVAAPNVSSGADNSSGSAAATTPTATTTNTAVLPDLAAKHGVVEGARLEVLWDLEDEETGEKKEVWWPCTVRGKAGIATMQDDGGDVSGGGGGGGGPTAHPAYKTVGLQVGVVWGVEKRARPQLTRNSTSDTQHRLRLLACVPRVRD